VHGFKVVDDEENWTNRTSREIGFKIPNRIELALRGFTWSEEFDKFVGDVSVSDNLWPNDFWPFWKEVNVTTAEPNDCREPPFLSKAM
jgi:hypothetical protein